MPDKPKQCFVIMPFGEKVDVDGKTIDFDRIYDVIHQAVTGEPMRGVNGLPLECIRSDKIAQAGWVHRLMISQIYDADVAIVDISTLNPNVFYELGVRHALRRNVTVLLCREGTKTPFNIAGFNCIRYDPDDPESLRSVQVDIARFVANGLRAGETDSLVYEVLEEQGWEGPPPRFLASEPRRMFEVQNLPGVRVGILTGGLQQIKDIDIWVNSENTNMQMALLLRTFRLGRDSLLGCSEGYDRRREGGYDRRGIGSVDEWQTFGLAGYEYVRDLTRRTQKEGRQVDF